MMNAGVFESHFELCRSTGDGGLQTLSGWVPEGVRVQLWSSGLGVPNRRYSLGGFIGAFRFIGSIPHLATRNSRVQLQSRQLICHV